MKDSPNLINGYSAYTLDHPYRIPMVTTFGNRDNTMRKGSVLVNCIAEKDIQTDEYWVEKRPGLLSYRSMSGTGRGMFNWLSRLYVINGNKLSLLRDDPLYNDVEIGQVDPNAGIYRFQKILSSPEYLVLGNGLHTYYTDGSTLTEITDPNFPTSLCKGFAYLDGTLYVMDHAAYIWGSKNLDDPTEWDALNFIQARMEPDNGIFLLKHQSYVVALKTRSTEAFYNAGNPTGSPLSPVPGSKQPYGCLSADSVQQLDDVWLWLSANESVSPQIVLMDGLKITVVSTPAVDRILDNVLQNRPTYQLWDRVEAHSLAIKQAGHRLYVLTLANQITLVYDLDQNLWYQWTAASSNYTNPEDAVYWPMVACSYSEYNHAVVQDENDLIYRIEGSYQYPNDNGQLFPVDIITPSTDFGVDRRKHLKMMRFRGDKVQGSKLLVRVSDDDYQTWSNFRLVDLGQHRPVLTNCGTFYNRAWHFRHLANTHFRIRSAELQMDLGAL